MIPTSNVARLVVEGDITSDDELIARCDAMRDRFVARIASLRARGIASSNVIEFPTDPLIVMQQHLAAGFRALGREHRAREVEDMLRAHDDPSRDVRLRRFDELSATVDSLLPDESGCASEVIPFPVSPLRKSQILGERIKEMLSPPSAPTRRLTPEIADIDDPLERCARLGDEARMLLGEEELKHD